MSSLLIDDFNLYPEFKEWYFKIIDEFKFDYQKDILARDYLSQILSKKVEMKNIDSILKSFINCIRKKDAIFIYGCGPSLENTIKNCQKTSIFEKGINLAADGSSILLKQQNIPIDAIFTDLDGITIEEFYYPKYLVIHAHGDNLDKLQYFEKDILKFKNLIGTTQVEPLHNILNPGGFTDGDRILFFIRNIVKSRQKIFFIGMDFLNIIGKYSKPIMQRDMEGNSIKIRKLEYAVQLLEWIMERIKNDIFFVNTKVVSKKFKYISLEAFIDRLN